MFKGAQPKPGLLVLSKSRGPAGNFSPPPGPVSAAREPFSVFLFSFSSECDNSFTLHAKLSSVV